MGFKLRKRYNAMNLLVGEEDIETYPFRTEAEARQKAKEDLKKLLSNKYALKNLKMVECNHWWNR